MEMEAENYVLALAAVGDTAEGFERLCDAIEEIDRRESLKYREEAVERAPLKTENEAGHADLPGYGCGE